MGVPVQPLSEGCGGPQAHAHQAYFWLPDAVWFVWADTSVGLYAMPVGADTSVGPEQEAKKARGIQA